MGRGRLRLKTWKREELEAGVVALVSVIIGGLILFYFLVSGPLTLAAEEEPDYVITRSSDFYRVINSTKPVAIMFSSDTCPVCQAMEPYWSELCRQQGGDIGFYLLKLNDDTIKVFVDYNVQETPTFIVFDDGRPVARHVGAFGGSNITETMLEWARLSTGKFGGEDLLLLKKYCGSCHPTPKSVNRSDILDWLKNASSDPMVSLINSSISSNVSPSQAVGGFHVLVGIVKNMNSSVDDQNATRIASLLDAIAVSLRAGKTGESVETVGQEHPAQGGVAGAVAITTALTAGLIASFSPCVFPVLLAYLSLLTQRRRKPLGAGAAFRAAAATAAGTLAVGVLFLALGAAAQSISRILLPVASLTLLAAGILGYMDVPTFLNVGVSTKRGLTGFSFLYGLLAVQCSFPLVAGALLLVASGGLKVGAASLTAFTLGISLPVGIAVWASQREEVAGLLNKLSGEEARRFSYLFLGVMGLVLLLYSLNVIVL
ncbi:MAG: thioredoxin domain-containing protein [Desulfurococcales archaeon]|nr:thioredoxin domain-containing protein [Desulfurococcales archaeon]